MVKNPRGEIFSPRGFANPRGDFDLCRGIFSRSLQILSQKPIEFPQSILLEISHFSFLCQLKVLGHFAKNWFGKKIPVAVIVNNLCVVLSKWRINQILNVFLTVILKMSIRV